MYSGYLLSLPVSCNCHYTAGLHIEWATVPVFGCTRTMVSWCSISLLHSHGCNCCLLVTTLVIWIRHGGCMHSMSVSVALVYVVQCRVYCRAVNRDILTDINSCLQCFDLPLVLRHCWLGVRKSIRPVKNWVMRCWRGYLSGARCKWFAYSPAGATTIPSSLASLTPHWFSLLLPAYPGCPGKIGCLSICLSDTDSCFCFSATAHVCISGIVVFIVFLQWHAIRCFRNHLESSAHIWYDY